MKTKCRCKHCRCFFTPNPRVKNQEYCSQEACQRARRRHWQRQKMKTDPDYRHNQKESQKKWRQDNPDYWRKYRKNHPKYRVHNRRKQKERDAKRREKRLAKMDALAPLNNIKTGSYYLIPVSEDLAKMDALKQEIYIISDRCDKPSGSCKKGLVGHRSEDLIR